MLSERQLRLLGILEQNNASAAELAKRVQVSSRTIMRDVDYINFTLAGAARIVPSAEGYRLDLQERARYFAILQRHDNDDRMLFALLVNNWITRQQFSALLNLPENMIAEKLSKLKSRYEKCFTLATRPGAGHFIDEPRSKKLLILANLIKKDPQTACHALLLSEESWELLMAAIPAVREKIAYPWPGNDYLASLLLAVYALRNTPTDETFAGDGTTPEWLLPLYDAATLFLTPESLHEAAALINYLQCQQNRVSQQAICNLLIQINQQHSLTLCDDELLASLTAHIARCAAWPVALPEYRKSGMESIKVAYPLAFDLSIALVARIASEFAIEIFDIDFIGLHFACALERKNVSRQKIILLSSQYAVANINKMAIEREIIAADVVIVTDVQALTALLQEVTPALVINNSHYSDELLPVSCRSLKNILSAGAIGQIKQDLEYQLISNNIRNYIPAENSFSLVNQPEVGWLAVVRAICDKLVRKRKLSQEDALRIYQRETEGDNLVINHIAVPHCISSDKNHFTGFFIQLTHPVLVNNDRVHHVLLTCTQPEARNELKIFSYLSHRLMPYEPSHLANIAGYEDFMTLLEQ